MSDEEMRKWENETEMFEEFMKELISNLNVDDDKETWDRKMSQAKERISSYWGKWDHIDKLLEFMSNEHRDYIIDALSKLCRVEPEVERCGNIDQRRVNDIVNMKRFYDKRVMEGKTIGVFHRFDINEKIRERRKRKGYSIQYKKGTNR